MGDDQAVDPITRSECHGHFQTAETLNHEEEESDNLRVKGGREKTQAVEDAVSTPRLPAAGSQMMSNDLGNARHFRSFSSSLASSVVDPTDLTTLPSASTRRMTGSVTNPN